MAATVTRRKTTGKASSILADLGLLRRGKRRGYVFVAGGVIAFVFFCLLSVWPQQKKILLLKQTQIRQKSLLELQQMNTELKVQLEHLVSYRNVEKYAQDVLQMRLPLPGEVVYVKKAGNTRE